jgi:Nanos RNA binding domain
MSSSSSSSSVSNSKPKSSSTVRVPVPVGARKFPDGFIGPVDMPFCKVCYDAGLPVADYTDHFVKDQPGAGGKVVCPTLLAQKCLTCGLPGHTSSYCPGTIRRETERNMRDRHEYEQSKKASGGWETVGAKGTAVKSSSSSSSSVKPKPRIEDMVSKKPTDQPGATTAPVTKKYGWFGALAVDDSSDSEEEREVTQLPTGIPKPVRKEAAIVTGPPPAIEPPKALTWAQRAAAAAQKPVSSLSSSSSSSSSSSASAPLVDTRFQLHAMCDNVEQSKRASASRRTVTSSETVNHRGVAAAIASESSKKRKHNSAMVPA